MMTRREIVGRQGNKRRTSGTTEACPLVNFTAPFFYTLFRQVWENNIPTLMAVKGVLDFSKDAYVSTILHIHATAATRNPNATCRRRAGTPLLFQMICLAGEIEPGHMVDAANICFALAGPTDYASCVLHNGEAWI